MILSKEKDYATKFSILNIKYVKFIHKEFINKLGLYVLASIATVSWIFWVVSLDTLNCSCGIWFYSRLKVSYFCSSQICAKSTNKRDFVTLHLSLKKTQTNKQKTESGKTEVTLIKQPTRPKDKLTIYVLFSRRCISVDKSTTKQRRTLCRNPRNKITGAKFHLIKYK